MTFSAIQIANILEGRVEGNEKIEINNISKIEEGSPGTISFLSNSKYEQFIYTTKASIVLVNQNFKQKSEIPSTLIRVEDAHKSFIKLLGYYQKSKILSKIGVGKNVVFGTGFMEGKDCYVGHNTIIGNNVKIGDNVKIFEQCYIDDDVVIGDNSVIFSGVKIFTECLVGKNCEISAGSIVGSDGFGFIPNENKIYEKVPHIGNVILKDDVNLGASVTIDRATLGSTIIGKGVKLDNQVHIAHNVVIGENTVIAAQTGIAGSSKIGARCVIGGQAGIAGHINVGDDVKLQAQSGVIKNIPDGCFQQGTPAFDYKSFYKSYVVFKNLPSLIKKIEAVKK